MFRQAAKLLAIAAMLVGFVNAQCDFTCGLQAVKTVASAHVCCPGENNDDQSETPNQQRCPGNAVLPNTTIMVADLAATPQFSLLPAHYPAAAPQALTDHTRVRTKTTSTPARNLTSFAILRI